MSGGKAVGGQDWKSKEISLLLPPLNLTCPLPAGQALFTRAIYSDADWQLLNVNALAITALPSLGFVHEAKQFRSDL